MAGGSSSHLMKFRSLQMCPHLKKSINLPNRPKQTIASSSGSVDITQNRRITRSHEWMAATDVTLDNNGKLNSSQSVGSKLSYTLSTLKTSMVRTERQEVSNLMWPHRRLECFYTHATPQHREEEEDGI